MKKSHSLDSVLTVSDSDSDDQENVLANIGSGARTVKYSFGSPTSETSESTDNISIFGDVPLYLPSTASEKEKRELKQMKYRRKFRSPKPNEVRNKTTEKLLRLSYSIRKNNLKKQFKEIARHPIDSFQARSFKSLFKSFFRNLPHFIVYFFVIIIYFRDVMLNFFRFSSWPTIVFFPFVIVIGVQLHAWLVWFQEIFNIYLFYILLVCVILGCAAVYFGDWILYHLFPKLTSSVLNGHILETTFAKFYTIPVSHSFDVPMTSLMPFYNKVTPIYLKKKKLQVDSSLSQSFEKVPDTHLKPYAKKWLQEKQNQYPYDLFRKIGKYVSMYKADKNTIKEEELFERIIKLTDRGMKELDDGDYGTPLLRQITPYRDWFPLHKNCRVTLYQDAHNGFNNRNCFEDMYDAIEHAKHIVYIAGWSINPNIRLKRDATDPKGSRTLGELLIDKANEGVAVYLILWNETGSNISSNLDTGDGQAISYFQNSRVVAVLSRRSGYTGLVFSHHQKTLICDKLSPEKNKRTVIAFIGGLDLTKGRYDTPSHSIFSTLDTYHREEVYNSRPLENKALGPRMPWHDIHSLIEGKCAYDILQNFEERWTTQLGFVSLPKRPTYVETFKENPWCVQVFRSHSKGPTFHLY